MGGVDRYSDGGTMWEADRAVMGPNGDDEVLYVDKLRRRLLDDVLLPGDLRMHWTNVLPVRHSRAWFGGLLGRRERCCQADYARSSLDKDTIRFVQIMTLQFVKWRHRLAYIWKILLATTEHLLCK